MSIYQQNKAYYSQPYRLSPKQMNHPTTVFEKFFDCIHLHHAREAIANMLFVALTSKNEAFADHTEREDVIYLCEQLEEVLEAAWLLRHSDKAAQVDGVDISMW